MKYGMGESKKNCHLVPVSVHTNLDTLFQWIAPLMSARCTARKHFWEAMHIHGSGLSRRDEMAEFLK
jgi:hypothetical protein